MSQSPNSQLQPDPGPLEAGILGLVELLGNDSNPIRIWRVHQSKCRIGSAPEAELRLDGYDVAPVHLTLTFGRRHVIAKAVGGSLWVGGRSTRECLFDAPIDLVLGSKTIRVTPIRSLSESSRSKIDESPTESTSDDLHFDSRVSTDVFSTGKSASERVEDLLPKVERVVHELVGPLVGVVDQLRQSVEQVREQTSKGPIEPAVERSELMRWEASISEQIDYKLKALFDELEQFRNDNQVYQQASRQADHNSDLELRESLEATKERLDQFEQQVHRLRLERDAAQSQAESLANELLMAHEASAEELLRAHIESVEQHRLVEHLAILDQQLKQLQEDAERNSNQWQQETYELQQLLNYWQEEAQRLQVVTELPSKPPATSNEPGRYEQVELTSDDLNPAYSERTPLAVDYEYVSVPTEVNTPENGFDNSRDTNASQVSDEENEEPFEFSPLEPLEFPNDEFESSTSAYPTSHDDRLNEWSQDLTDIPKSYHFGEDVSSDLDSPNRPDEELDASPFSAFTDTDMDNSDVLSEEVLEHQDTADAIGSDLHDHPAPAAFRNSDHRSADAEEDSIEAYMQQLLQRVRGSSEAVIGGASASIQPGPGNNSETTRKPSADLKPSLTAMAATGLGGTAAPFENPSGQKDSQSSDEIAAFAPRQLPEQNHNLAAMRELANNGARTAIEKSDRRKRSAEAFFKASVAMIGFMGGTFLFMLNGFRPNMALVGCCAGLGVAAMWGWESMGLIKTILETEVPEERALPKAVPVATIPDDGTVAYLEAQPEASSQSPN